MEPKQRVILTIYQIYMFLYALVLMVLSILGYLAIGDPLANYELVLLNWSQYPITDIYTAQVCDAQDKILSDYRWPGTFDGCDCRGASKLYDGLYRKRCDSNQTNAGCHQIGSVGDRHFLNFTDQEQTIIFMLCGIQDKSFDFITKAPLTYDCPEGTMKCGEDDIFICTNQTKCPIVDLGYFNDNNQSNEHFIVTDTFKLWYNRYSQGLFPLVEFRMAEGEGVCIQNTEQSITDGRSDYLLMEVKKQNCGKDPRFRQLYMINEKWFFEINRSLDLPKLLPEYSIDPKYRWGLYYRGYIPWKMQCRGEIKDEFQQQHFILRELNDIQYALFISTIVYFSVIAFAVNLISICLKEVAIIFLIFNIMFQVSFATLTFLQMNHSYNEVEIFNKIYGLNCTDTQTQWVIQDLSHNLYEYSFQYNAGLFSISIFSFTFYILPMMYYLCLALWDFFWGILAPFLVRRHQRVQQLEMQQRYNVDEKNMEENAINLPKI